MNSQNFLWQYGSTGVINIPAGVFEFTSPLILPDAPVVIRGAGVGLTELRFHGENIPGIIAPQSSLNHIVDISGLTITTDATQGGNAIDISFPEVGAFHDPTVLISEVRIRPAQGSEFKGAFRKGINLHNAWSPTINKVWIQGRYDEMTPELLLKPTMECGVDFGNAQEAKLSYAQIVCVGTGVHVEANAQGKGEGLAVTSSAIVNARTGIRAEGGVWGGWAVPWLNITDNHMFTLDHGVFATGRSDVSIKGNSFCGSQFTQWSIGVYLAAQCKNMRISGNSFWTTKPGQGHGIVIDQSTNAVIFGNVFDSAVRIGVWVTDSSQDINTENNSNTAALPVIDSQQRAA